jgi:RNA polymerase sigma-70 factor, ECF subfamily
MALRTVPQKESATGANSAMHSTNEVTALLIKWGEGDREAFHQLFPLVSGELHRLAKRKLRGERQDHTLQTTELVHEAYLRLVDQKRTTWVSRTHFYAIAAQAMRRILVDYSRRRLSQKRGGTFHRVEFDQALGANTQEEMASLIELDEALLRLSKLDPLQGRVVELRAFGGQSVEETAQCLAISPRTVKREMRLAKAWLFREIRRK